MYYCRLKPDTYSLYSSGADIEVISIVVKNLKLDAFDSQILQFWRRYRYIIQKPAKTLEL